MECRKKEEQQIIAQEEKKAARMGIAKKEVNPKKSSNKKGETRRQRQRRIREQRKQRRNDDNGDNMNQTTEDYDNHRDNELDNNHHQQRQEELLPGNMFVQLGKDLVDTKLASNATTKEDVCPVCNDRFHVELENHHAVVLACRHACCLPCLADLTKSSDRQKNALSYVCPICRSPIESQCLRQFASHIAKKTRAIRDRLFFGLRRLGWNERWSIAERLVVNHRFIISNVLDSLDDMTLDNLQPWRVEDDLSHEEKQQIYKQARQPVDTLREELYQMRMIQLGGNTTVREKIDLEKKIRDLQERIVVANKNAQDEIYSRINDCAGMGRISNSGRRQREIQIDFHGLHVKEAKAKFDELALQILPVTGTILLIVGRGLHSEGGIAKLKEALILHLKEHSKRKNLRWEKLQQNEGILRAKWIDE